MIGFLALALLGLCPPALAERRVTSNERSQIFLNDNCSARDSCALKQAWLKTLDFRVTMSDGSHGHGTRMTACFETSKAGDLEEFGFAQFIKGCQYFTSQKNRRVVYEDYVQVRHGSSLVPYHHPQWVIDGFVDDPLSWGDRPKASRLHHYWNRIPGWEAGQTSADVFGLAGARGPLLCVRDMPGAAYADSDSAKNVSVRFRTCLYKTAEVPASTTLETLQSIAPLHCFDWSSSFVFNHESGQYQSPADIAPFCMN
ncbi:MAG: hypothetical protein AAB036_04285 [Elusimicrobiota bacterium]